MGLNFKGAGSGSLFNINWLETMIPTGFETKLSRVDRTVVAFPNPCMNELNITSTEVMERILILDETGRIILEKLAAGRNCVVPTGGLQRGLFFIRIESLKGSQYLKVIKS